jgi:hypothetical protein
VAARSDGLFPFRAAFLGNVRGTIQGEETMIAKTKNGGDTDRPEIAASSKVVLALIRKGMEAKTRIQSVAGELGEEIKNAVETKHLHAGALRHVTRLARMDTVKRDGWLRACALYIDYAIEAGLFGGQHMGDLVDQARDAAGDGENAGSDNVRKLRRGIKHLPDHEPDLPPAA